MPGPVPKRKAQRRRRNAKRVDTAPAAPAAGGPKAKTTWHPIARQWYTAIASAGMARFYDVGDWATAYAAAEALSRALHPQVIGTFEGKPIKASMPIPAATMTAFLRACAVLGATEGDRRRLGIELERPAEPEEDGADVSELADYRRRAQPG